LDKNKIEALLASGFKRVDVPFAEGAYETFDKAFAFNDSTIELDPDLMHVRFILCHEGVNANGDYFTKEVLQAAQVTPRNKPIDWEHGQPIIGTMLDSAYREDASGRGYIEAVGVVWKFIYPELSGDIKKKAATGELRLSMECYYRDANYKVGDTLYTQADAEKLGLIQYVGREYMGNKVTRVFNEVVFGGVGVVANPADKEAVFLSVAKDLSNHGIEVSAENVEEVSQAVADAITRTINDFKSKTVDKETLTALTVAKYVKAFDKAKSAVVGKFNKDENRTKEQFVSEVRSILDTFLSEVATINTNYYKGVAGEVESAEARDLFFDEIQSTLATMIYKHYSSFDESLDAYLVRVSEDYFIYELIDYSKPFPDSTRIYKGFYNIVDGEVVIHFEKAIEVEQIYVEKASDNPDKEETEEMTKKANTAVAGEETVDLTITGTPVFTSEAEETKCCDNAPECDCNVDYKAQASDLSAQVATLTTELESANSAKASLEARVAELEGQLGEIEAEKVAQARQAELSDLGIKLSEARQAKLKGMTDEEYADFKDLLVEVAGSKKEEAPVAVASEEVPVVEEPVLEEAEASEEEVEEEIVVETPKASASLNIETQTKEFKPFGHLSAK
jgi:hypothetical protein